MYIDGELLFTGAGTRTSGVANLAQTVTASAASTNLIDLGAARQLGVGNPPLYAVFVVTEAFTDASSNSTVAVTLETDTAAAFSSATTAQTIGTFAALSAIGTKLVVPLAPFSTAERYLRAYFTVANGDLTTGKIVGVLTTTPELWTAYADNITIE